MRTDTQRALVEEVLELHGRQTTSQSDEVLRIPASDYTCEEHARREREAWLLGQPNVAGLGGDIPKPGDYLCYEIAGVPIVVVRGPDGVVRAYENVCRHRAAPVARDRGHLSRHFQCPFHGWTYDVRDGRLVAQPKACGGFESLDASTLGLRRLAVSERHGLIVVDPRRRARSAGHDPGPDFDADLDVDVDVDVEGWLGGLDDEIDSMGYGGYVPFRSRVDAWACNWKLLLDTFFESYHVFSLHAESLAPQYLGIASTAHGFGAHNRLVVPMKSILDLESQPRETWQLMPHAVVQYFLAPNVILSHYHDVLAMTRFTPLSAGTTEVMQALFTRGPVLSEDERAGHDRRFEFAHAITSGEDYPESVRVHRSLASGRVEHTLIGRNEVGVAIFHEAIARRMREHDESRSLPGAHARGRVD